MIEILVGLFVILIILIICSLIEDLVLGILCLAFFGGLCYVVGNLVFSILGAL